MTVTYPISPLNLVQEQQLGKPFVAWRIAVVCALLNRTHGRQVRPMVEDLFVKWPSSHAMCFCEERPLDRAKLCELLKPLGFGNRRASTILSMSKWFSVQYSFLGTSWELGMRDGSWARQVPGCGEYVVDSLDLVLYRKVVPDRKYSDTWLNEFADWMRTFA